MGASDGPEAAKLAVLATLKTYLPATLAAIASARADGLNPPAPATASYLADWREQIATYPALMVCSSGGRLVNDGSTIWHGLAHGLEVVAALQSNNLHALQTQGQRMILAIEQVLGKHQTLDGTLSDIISVQLGRYGRALEKPAKGQKALYTLFVAWEVTVQTNEIL